MVLKTKKMRTNFKYNNGVGGEGTYDPEANKVYIDTLTVTTPYSDGPVETRYNVSKMDKDTARYVNEQIHKGIHDPAVIVGGMPNLEALAEQGLVSQKRVAVEDDREIISLGKNDLNQNSYSGQLLSEKREAYADRIIKENRVPEKRINELMSSEKLSKKAATKQAALEQAERVVDYTSAVRSLEMSDLPEYVRTVSDLFSYAGAAELIVDSDGEEASKVLSDVNEPLTAKNFDLYVGLLEEFKPNRAHVECTGAAKLTNARQDEKDEGKSSIAKYVAAGIGLGTFTGIAIADVGTAIYKKQNLVNALDDILIIDGSHINESGNAHVNFTTWLGTENAGHIQITYDNNSSTFIFQGVDSLTGRVVTDPYSVPANQITGTGRINAEDMQFTFMPNGSVNKDTYKLKLSTNLSIDDLANMRVVLSGNQNGNVYMKNVWLNGTENSYINGLVKGNVSEVTNAHGYLNITGGWINGTGYTKDLNITGGKGKVHFNDTEINGNLTGYVKLDQLTAAKVTINGTMYNKTKGPIKLKGNMTGYVYYTNGKDRVRVDGNTELLLNETQYFVGAVDDISVEGWMKLSTGNATQNNMTVTGYAELEDINFYNATGNMTMNLTIGDGTGGALKGYISDFTIPKAGFNGTVQIKADQIKLRANDIRAELGGTWGGTGTAQKINNNQPLGKISGYAEMDLANMLNATGYKSNKDIMIQNIVLDVGETTVSGQNAFFTADKPLELRLSGNSTIVSNGDMVDLTMKGYTSGDIKSSSEWDTPATINPFSVIVPVMTATGLVLGYMVGTKSQIQADNRATRSEIKRVIGNHRKGTIAEAKATQAEIKKLGQLKITAEPDKTVKEDIKTVITKLDENSKKMDDYFTLPKETTDAIDAVFEEAHKRHY